LPECGLDAARRADITRLQCGGLGWGSHLSVAIAKRARRMSGPDGREIAGTEYYKTLHTRGK
jgi:hypothetical protein